MFYDKHGEKGFLVALFLPVVRTVAPFLAGMANMRMLKFGRSASLGAVIWVLVCVLAGYYFGHIAAIKTHLGLVTLLGLGMVIAVFFAQKTVGYPRKICQSVNLQYLSNKALV